MGYIVTEGDVKFVLCCPAMRRAVRVHPRDEAARAPHFDTKGPVVINGCDGDSIKRDPVRFCPWCGREILPKNRAVAILWDLRKRLDAEERSIAGNLTDEDKLSSSIAEAARLRSEIRKLGGEVHGPPELR